MISTHLMTKDVIPIFQLYNRTGDRIEEMEHLINQPDQSSYLSLKESIILITPPQPNIETLMKCGLLIKLLGLRLSDGCESKKYTLNYVPSDYYDPCIFCDLNHDGHQGKAKLPGPTELSKTGKKKIIKPKNTNTQNNESDFQSKGKNTPCHSISDSDESCILSLTADEDSNSYPTSTSESNVANKTIEQDIEKEIPALVVTSVPGPMPGLINLKLLQSLENCHPHIKAESDNQLITAKEEKSTLLSPNDAYDIPVSEPEGMTFENFESSKMPNLLPIQHSRQRNPTIPVIVGPPMIQDISTTASPSVTSYPVSLKQVDNYAVKSVPSVIDKTLHLAALDDLDSIDMNESSFHPPVSLNILPPSRGSNITTPIYENFPAKRTETQKISPLDNNILKSYLMGLEPIQDCRPHKKMKT